jgi:hypothetical protein
MSGGIPYDGASAYEVDTIKSVQRTNAVNLTNDVLTVLFTIFSFCLVSDRVAGVCPQAKAARHGCGEVRAQSTMRQLILD